MAVPGDTVYTNIAVKDKPAVTIVYNNNACQNTNYILTAAATVNAGSIASYTWLKNGTVLPNNTTTIIENNAAGSYTYKLAVTSTQGCTSDTAMQLVTAEKYPVAIFTATGGCVGKPIVMTNSSINNNTAGSLQYLWTTSDGQTSNASIPGFSFAASGTKNIQLTATTPNGCATSLSKTVTIEAYPVAAYDITEACMGKTLTISNKSTGSITSYAWQTSNAQQSSSVVPQLIFNSPGNYSIQLTVATANNCSTTIIKNASIIPLQLSTVPAVDTNAVTGQQVQLSITGAASYNWQPVTYLSNTGSSNPVFTATIPGIYPVAVEGTSLQGCKGNATITIKVFAATNYLYIPNAFTPNGDGLNDKFRIVCSGLKELQFFTIHNRYGQLLYRQNNCNAGGWDGNFNGNAQPLGAYVYSWQGIAYNGQPVSGKGTVMLVR